MTTYEQRYSSVKLYRVTPGNFGDDLNNLYYERFFDGFANGYCYLGQVTDENFESSDLILLCIGTILNKRVPSVPAKVVLGSGVGYGQPAVLDENWHVSFVRGPMTAKALGLESDVALTDPGMALAEIVPRTSTKTSFRFGYMPHHATSVAPAWRSICQDLGILYIDPRRDIDAVLADLFNVEVLIAEAMHGAIIADSYGIPWIPAATSSKVNKFKWDDWCSSVGLTYTPYRLPSIWAVPKNVNVLKRGWAGAKDVIRKPIAASVFKKMMRENKAILSDRKRRAELSERIIQKYIAFSEEFR